MKLKATQYNRATVALMYVINMDLGATFQLKYFKVIQTISVFNRPIFYRFPIVKSTFKQKCVKFCIIFLLGRCMTLNKFIYVYITVQLGLQEAQWPNVHLKFVNYILFDFSWKYCKKWGFFSLLLLILVTFTFSNIAISHITHCQVVS